jgi:hypothetical protein
VTAAELAADAREAAAARYARALWAEQRTAAEAEAARLPFERARLAHNQARRDLADALAHLDAVLLAGTPVEG